MTTFPLIGFMHSPEKFTKCNSSGVGNHLLLQAAACNPVHPYHRPHPCTSLEISRYWKGNQEEKARNMRCCLSCSRKNKLNEVGNRDLGMHPLLLWLKHCCLFSEVLRTRSTVFNGYRLLPPAIHCLGMIHHLTGYYIFFPSKTTAWVIEGDKCNNNNLSKDIAPHQTSLELHLKYTQNSIVNEYCLEEH